MAARATFRVGLVIGDILVTGHAGCAVGAHLDLVNVVAGCALGVAFPLRNIPQAVQTWQLGDFVTAGAAGLRRYRASMGLVASHALPMTCRAVGELFLVAAYAGDNSGRLMHRPLVAPFATGMAQIAAS